MLAFEAAAKHQSFTNAASELALSESAISRQITMLEEQLGLKLFHRIKKRVTLTRAGERYSKQVAQILDQIERDMLNIMAHGGQRDVLELAVLPSFCSQWMIPRLPSFYKRYPDITINAHAHSVMFMFKDTNYDAAIHFGQPNWPGAEADFLFKEDVVMVGKPQILRQKQIKVAEDVLNHTLLHLSSRSEAWRNWFDENSLAEADAIQGSRFELFSLLISAACAGLGIALIPRYLISKELKEKNLEIVDHVTETTQNAYYLVYPDKNLIDNSSLLNFRNWLQEEVKTYQECK